MFIFQICGDLSNPCKHLEISQIHHTIYSLLGSFIAYLILLRLGAALK